MPAKSNKGVNLKVSKDILNEIKEVTGLDDGGDAVRKLLSEHKRLESVEEKFNYFKTKFFSTLYSVISTAMSSDKEAIVTIKAEMKDLLDYLVSIKVISKQDLPKEK